MKICVYGICKNEINFLERCFNSLWEADYICILDTGSTDGTYEKLQEWHNKYPEKFVIAQREIQPWRFDNARNESLKLIPADTTICLSVDMDDVLRPGWRELLIKHYEAGYNKIIGKYLYYDGDISGNMTNLDRYHPYGQAHWENAIHERLVVENEKCVHDSSFIVEHRQDLTKNRREIYLAAAKEGANENDYANLCLGYELNNHGDLIEATECFETLYNKLQNETPVSQYLTRKWLLLLGHIYEHLNESEKSVLAYKRAAEVYNQTSPFEDYYNYDGNWQSELALRYYYLGHFDEAYYFGARAVEANPTSELYRSNYIYYLRKMFELYPENDTCILDHLKLNISTDGTILDVGPYFGKWYEYLHTDYSNIDAVEIFEPYVEQYALKTKYNRVFVDNICNFKFNYYDALILGDVLEHLTTAEVTDLIKYLQDHCNYAYFVIPFNYVQDAYDENINQIHKQSDLTVETIAKRYPELQPLATNAFRGYYYLKGKYDSSEQLNSMQNKVAVYAICKNESNNVATWLNACKKADKIIVVDTGSTDGTVLQLRQATQQYKQLVVYKYDTTDNFDFSAARNYALTLTKDLIQAGDTTNWIYCSLDFDEVVDDNFIDELKAQWKSTYDFMYIYAHNVNMWSLKIHNGAAFWRYSIHEGLKTQKHNAVYVNLDHTGYNHYQDSKKTRSYYEALKAALKEEPECVHYLTYASWEANLHNETEQCLQFSLRALNAINSNSADEYYLDSGYALYACCNIYDSANRLQSVSPDLAIKLLKALEQLTIDCQTLHLYKAFCMKQLGMPEYRTELLLAKTTPKQPYWWEQAIDYDLIDAELQASELNKTEEMTNMNTNSINYLELAQTAFRNKQYLQALSYADTAMYVTHAAEAKSFRNTCCEIYLASLQTRHYDKNKVAVYAITKNEMKFVDKWYKSMSEADYIVVLDTGSTDGTYERFQELAKADSRIIIAQQEFKPWRFDLPRNIAMSLVPEDANILLSTDLDEILEPGWYEDLTSNWIEGTHTRATYQYAWSHNPSGAPGRVFWYNKVHDWTWIWRYPVHELLYSLHTDGEQYAYEHNITLNKMYLHHYPDPTKSRGNYLPLLEQRAKEDNADVYGLIYLSHEYNYRGFYQQSIDLLTDIVDRIEFADDSTLKASCYLFLGDDYVALGNTTAAIDAYKQAIIVAPRYREPYLNLAQVYINANQYTEAIHTIKQALTNSVRQYSWLERDISWTYQPYDLLCLAYYYSGEKLKALACAYRAFELEPAEPRLSDNIKSVLNNLSNEEW